jgi:hypothetical protein
MKLVALQHIHLADDYAKRKGLRYREVKKGETFDIKDADADSLIVRDLAMKEPDAKQAKAEAAKAQAQAEAEAAG